MTVSPADVTYSVVVSIGLSASFARNRPTASKFSTLKPSGLMIFQVITKFNKAKNLEDVTIIEREQTIGYNLEQLGSMIHTSGLRLVEINRQELECEARDRAAWFWCLCKKGQIK